MVDSKKNLAWCESFDFDTSPAQSHLYVRLYECNVNKYEDTTSFH